MLETPQITIAIADDEELFRKGIIFILEREPTFNVVYEASNGKELVEYVRTTKQLPDLILTDLKMPELSGIEATRIIGHEFPEIKIIALTSYNTRSFIANMVHIGSASYLVKNSSPKEVLFTIKEVISKGFHYTFDVMKIIHQDLNAGSKGMLADPLEQLTPREREVLQLICDQMTTQEIADKLKISPRTVEGYRNNLLSKTNSKNTAGLVLYAIRNNLIIIDTNF